MDFILKGHERVMERKDDMWGRTEVNKESAEEAIGVSESLRI